MAGALRIVFFLTCLFAGKMAEVRDQKTPPTVHQEIRSVSTAVGESVTLECVYNAEKISRLYWYKQTLGDKPTVIASFYRYNDQVSFEGEFQNNSRFTMSSKNSVNRLVIADLQSSDSATYFCATSYVSRVDFAEGTAVLVRGADAGFPIWVHQWASGSVQWGGSVTLQCRVETGSCAGGARVYWLRESRQAKVGVLLGSQQQQCVRNAGTQTHSCLYTLPMSLDPSHTGIYYCAVASCGRLLFGNGTNLDFGPETDSRLYFWSGVSAFTTPLSLSLAFFVCVMNRRNSPCAGSSTISTAKSGDDVMYAASGTTKKPRSEEDDTWSECVYLMVEK